MGRTKDGHRWHRREYDDTPRKLGTAEHVVYFVSYRASKARANRRAFWVHLPPSYNSPPPIEEGNLGRFLAVHLARRGVEMPQVVRIQRNQALGEKPGIHSVGMFAVSEDGTLRVLKSYPGSRGIPHTPPERDFWFKRASVRPFASAHRPVPADPASLARASVQASAPLCGPVGFEVQESRPICGPIGFEVQESRPT